LPVVGTRHIVCWAVAIALFGVGGFLIFFDRRYKHSLEAKTRQDAVDCLDEIEEEFPNKGE